MLKLIADLHTHTLTSGHAYGTIRENAQAAAEAGLKIYFMAILFAGFNIILQVYFTSREIPFPAQAISVLRGFAVIVPASYLLAETVGITGVWLSFPVTEAVVAIIGLLIYTMDKRRSLK